jgi:transposase
MSATKYLNIDEQLELSLYKFIENSNKPREKKRAIAILMSNDKKNVREIAKKMGMNPDTVYDWLINFEKEGLEGIKDKPMPGRPKKIRVEAKENITEVFKKKA